MCCLLKLPVKLGQEQKQGKSPEWSHNQSRNSILTIRDDFARRGSRQGKLFGPAHGTKPSREALQHGAPLLAAVPMDIDQPAGQGFTVMPGYGP